MPDAHDLSALCRRLDGRPYPAYRDLRGAWHLDGLSLRVDHVQGDPFAAPSRVRIRVQTGIRPEQVDTPARRMAAEDWLLRRFGARLQGNRRGSGRSGALEVYRPGPEITRRSAVRLLPSGEAEVRFLVGLPAQGRRILGRQAAELLLDDVPQAASQLAQVAEEPGLAAWLASVDTQQALRDQLGAQGLVAFVADGSVLPRRSGVSREPMEGAVPFESPPGLRTTLDSPSGPVAGMGIPEGISLIVGGGFHGKSTLLQAVQWGHLDHIPGDGRERVVSRPRTAKVRAEDGRAVAGVDISAFLRDLPGGRTTRPFSTEDASGSTSQAAAIVEAVEAGATLLLMDEDTCATNLMVRDERMRQLVPREREPITPLVERVRQVYGTLGVSVIIVVGGVGDYLAVADTVVGMEDFRPVELTARARELAGPAPEAPEALEPFLDRPVVAASLAPTGKGRIRARDERRIDHGQEEIDLSAVDQVLDGAHARSLGQALRLLSEAGGSRTLPELLALLETLLEAEDIEVLSPWEAPSGDLVWPRGLEVAAALNRLRTLVVRSPLPERP